MHRVIVFAAMAVAALAAAPAVAQTPPATARQAAQAQPPLVLTGVATGWVKVCQGTAQTRGGCVVSNEVFTENGSSIGSVGIQETMADRRRRMVMVVPHGMWLEDGVQFRVDNNPPITSPYGTCLVNGCFASFIMTDAMIQQMRRGRQVTLTAKEPSERPVTIPIDLTNFAAVFDGAPMSPEAVSARTEAFQAEMRRRQQARQGGAAAPPATPPTVAPTVPAPQAPRQ